MLDEFSVSEPAGFPDHPHRGFETVTYMLEGVFEHEDFTGRKGLIGPGDLQVGLRVVGLKAFWSYICAH
jgi:redox-sensitive bicupin YhaK (pirin superfamily)